MKHKLKIVMTICVSTIMTIGTLTSPAVAFNPNKHDEYRGAYDFAAGAATSFGAPTGKTWKELRYHTSSDNGGNMGASGWGSTDGQHSIVGLVKKTKTKEVFAEIRDSWLYATTESVRGNEASPDAEYACTSRESGSVTVCLADGPVAGKGFSGVARMGYHFPVFYTGRNPGDAYRQAFFTVLYGHTVVLIDMASRGTNNFGWNIEKAISRAIVVAKQANAWTKPPKPKKVALKINKPKTNSRKLTGTCTAKCVITAKQGRYKPRKTTANSRGKWTITLRAKPKRNSRISITATKSGMQTVKKQSPKTVKRK